MLIPAQGVESGFTTQTESSSGVGPSFPSPETAHQSPPQTPDNEDQIPHQDRGQGGDTKKGADSPNSGGQGGQEIQSKPVEDGGQVDDGILSLTPAEEATPEVITPAAPTPITESASQIELDLLEYDTKLRNHIGVGRSKWRKASAAQRLAYLRGSGKQPEGLLERLEGTSGHRGQAPQASRRAPSGSAPTPTEVPNAGTEDNFTQPEVGAGAKLPDVPSETQPATEAVAAVSPPQGPETPAPLPLPTGRRGDDLAEERGYQRTGPPVARSRPAARQTPPAVSAGDEAVVQPDDSEEPNPAITEPVKSPEQTATSEVPPGAVVIEAVPRGVADFWSLVHEGKAKVPSGKVAKRISEDVVKLGIMSPEEVDQKQRTMEGKRAILAAWHKELGNRIPILKETPDTTVRTDSAPPPPKGDDSSVAPAIEESAKRLGLTNGQFLALPEEERVRLLSESHLARAKEQADRQLRIVREEAETALKRLNDAFEENLPPTAAASAEVGPKTAELGPRQFSTLSKALDKYNSDDPSTLPDLTNSGLKGAVLKARRQLGIKPNPTNPAEVLNELKEAFNNGRIKGKAPIPRESTPRPPQNQGQKESDQEAKQGFAERITKGAAKKVRAGAEKYSGFVAGREESLRAKAEASESRIKRFLFNSAANFLNNYHARDKEAPWYYGAFVVSGGANAALTIFAPFTAVGPGRFLRSLAITGTTHALGAGVNLGRRVVMGSVLSGYIDSDEGAKNFNFRSAKDARNYYVTQFNEAFLLKRIGEEEFGARLQQLSQEVFLRFGKTAFGHNFSKELEEGGLRLLRERMMGTLDRYHQYNNIVRSVAAGMKAGATVTTIGFGIDQGLSKGFEKLMGLIHHPTAEVPGQPGLPSGPPDYSKELPLAPPEGSNVNPEDWRRFASAYNSLTPDRRDDFIEIMGDPKRVQDLIDWSEAHNVVTPPTPEAIPIEFQRFLDNQNNFTELDINRGDTVGKLAFNRGYDNFWDANPTSAAAKGATILENEGLLRTSAENAARQGYAAADMPTHQELIGLMRQAAGGNEAADAELDRVLHWIPQGRKLRLLKLGSTSEIIKELDLAA
ncbi:MAG: hypothetical protein WD231_03775 [Candidatus Woykebacteria bacterium]